MELGLDMQAKLTISDSECFFFLISKMRKGKKERKKSLTLALLSFFIMVSVSRTREARSLRQKTS